MFLKQNDGFLLKLLWLGLRNQLRETTVYTKLFFVYSGILCLLWPMSDLRDLLHITAVLLCATQWLWPAALAIFFITGTCFGLYSAGLALAHVDSRYLRVQPISEQAGRRMAIVAAIAGSLLTAPAAAIVLTTICETINKSAPFAWGFGAALAHICGAGLGILARLTNRFEIHSDRASPAPGQMFHIPLPTQVQQVDRAYPTWLSSWAIGLEAGRLPFSWSRMTAISLLGLAAILPCVASLADHQSGPALAGAVVAGLCAFMLVVRCEPLLSPVLTTAPIGFMQAWLAMLRLPLLVSAVFFVIPAGAAVAAQPSAWAMNISAALGLLVLDGAYAVFAAFFLLAPLLAASSFFAAVCYASYKWMTYHAVVYACFAGLLVLMGYRVRRSFYNGN
jgi:hypothetical protein